MLTTKTNYSQSALTGDDNKQQTTNNTLRHATTKQHKRSTMPLHASLHVMSHVYVLTISMSMFYIYVVLVQCHVVVLLQRAYVPWLRSLSTKQTQW